MYENKLGQFNIRLVNINEHFVRLWTDAPVNSPRAQEWFNDILEGPGGIAEINEVIVGQDFIALDFSSDVQTEGQLKYLVRCFMQLVDEKSKMLDALDLHMWYSTVNSLDIQGAMAISSITNADYGVADYSR